jgi:hypothetical protein
MQKINMYEALVVFKNTPKSKEKVSKCLFVTKDVVVPWNPSLFLLKSIILNANLAPSNIRHDWEWINVVDKFTIKDIKLIKEIGAEPHDMERHYTRFKEEARRDKNRITRNNNENDNISNAESIPCFLRRGLSVFRNKTIGYSPMHFCR